MGAGSAGSSGSNDTDVSGAEAVTFGGTTYSDKKRKGYKPADYDIEKDDSFYEPPKKKNILEKIVDNSILTNNPFSKKSEEVNRKFFEEKVKPAGKSKYNTYEDYIKARGRGEVDAYGREITQRDDGGNNQPAQETIVKKNIGGSEVQTTQEKLDEEKDNEYDVRKVKKKGRSKNILTSSKGVTQLSDDYSLSKKSLLGTL
tara:strand:+ start:1312 stop:1914 length:603 start_codon:yes stop_codon:yes gene_type:complete